VEDKLREEQYNFIDNRSRVDLIFAEREKEKKMRIWQSHMVFFPRTNGQNKTIFMTNVKTAAWS
jgi:hypothetical protein